MIECTELDGLWRIGICSFHHALERKDYRSAYRYLGYLKIWMKGEAKCSPSPMTRHYATMLLEILEKEGE